MTVQVDTHRFACPTSTSAAFMPQRDERAGTGQDGLIKALQLTPDPSAVRLTWIPHLRFDKLVHGVLLVLIVFRRAIRVA